LSDIKEATVRSAGPLRKCIATVALSGTLRDKLEACASVGFDGVEIMESDLLTFEGSPADVRRICEDLGLTIEIYQPFRDFEAMPEPSVPATWTARNGNSMSCRHSAPILCWCAATP
jgi:sugar phosphate isomerase/epimerase